MKESPTNLAQKQHLKPENAKLKIKALEEESINSMNLGNKTIMMWDGDNTRKGEIIDEGGGGNAAECRQNDVTGRENV